MKIQIPRTFLGFMVLVVVYWTFVLTAMYLFTIFAGEKT